MTKIELRSILVKDKLDLQFDKSKLLTEMSKVFDGVPRYQVRKAEGIGLTEPEQINAFVLDNADQPDEVCI